MSEVNKEYYHDVGQIERLKVKEAFTRHKRTRLMGLTFYYKSKQVRIEWYNWDDGQKMLDHIKASKPGKLTLYPQTNIISQTGPA